MNKIFYSCLLLALCGCASTEYNTGTHKQDVMFYSTEKEVLMGQNIAREIAKIYKITSNPVMIERVDRIGKLIANVCGRKEISYYFYVIDEDEVNAFSIPGGYVYIYRGLLEKLNDDELAFVLAHETGHIVSRHNIKKLQAMMGYNIAVLASAAVPADAEFRQGVSFALAQVLVAYSREDELNADELAVEYTRASGFKPIAGIDVMEKLYKEDKKSIRPISYFRTHPYTAERIRHIKETLRLPLGVDDYIN